jgi:glycosyltransferase involved in cell wall biosynthesis
MKLSTVASFECYMHIFIKAEIERLVNELDLSYCVLFTGILSEKEKIDALRACDILVRPSIYEGFGLMLIEAQASGKPVVATGAGGMLSAVRDGDTGFLVSFGDKNQLSEKILRLLEDERLAHKMG